MLKVGSNHDLESMLGARTDNSRSCENQQEKKLRRGRGCGLRKL